MSCFTSGEVPKVIKYRSLQAVMSHPRFSSATEHRDIYNICMHEEKSRITKNGTPDAFRCSMLITA